MSDLVNFNPNDGEPMKGKAMLPSLKSLGSSPFSMMLDNYLTILSRDAAMKAGPNTAFPPQAGSFTRLSFMPDVANAGLLQWPGINPDTLRKVGRENTGPMMVINARLRDIGRYAGLSQHPWRPGWCIEMMDPNKPMSEAVRKDVRDAERFIFNCSRDYTYSDARERDFNLVTAFETYLKQCVHDMLTFDGWSTWTNMDRSGRIISFASLPAGNIRLADPLKGYRGDPARFAALVDETGNPVTAFTRDEMFWLVRNPRNDPDVKGYGWPEIEQAVLVIQAFQNAIQLNADTFTRNAIPNGIMLLKGDYWTPDQLDLLTREWKNMKNGISKTWGLPVMAVPADGEIDIVSMMDIKGQDVRYRDHMNMMIGIISIIYQFPLRRFGFFTSGHHKDNAPLPDESVEIAGIDDPGLPDLLTHIENGLNQYVVWPNWPHLKFAFKNKDPKNDAREYEAKSKARTWREARAEADLPELTTLVQGEGEDKEELRFMAEIMNMCPEDPGKAGVFQSIAAGLIKAKYEPAGGDGKDPETAGPRMRSKTDPAKSREHGHTAGVRRNSAREAASAANNVT